MSRMDEARACAVAAGYIFSEHDLAKFARMIEMTEARMATWLEEELTERRMFDFEGDKAEWESIVPDLIAQIRDGSAWL